VDPLEDLPSMKFGMAKVHQFLLNFMQFEAGEIGFGSHDVGLTPCAENSDCTMPWRPFEPEPMNAVATRNCISAALDRACRCDIILLSSLPANPLVINGFRQSI
jgi:hypothetical protein